MRPADSFRDLVGKTVANIRTMNDSIEYEFGVDRIQHQHAGDTILRASLTAVAFFWNGYAVLHREEDSDFLAEPRLIKLRSILADGMDAMAQSVTRKTDFAASTPRLWSTTPCLPIPATGSMPETPSRASTNSRISSFS